MKINKILIQKPFNKNRDRGKEGAEEDIQNQKKSWEQEYLEGEKYIVFRKKERD